MRHSFIDAHLPSTFDFLTKHTFSRYLSCFNVELLNREIDLLKAHEAFRPQPCPRLTIGSLRAPFILVRVIKGRGHVLHDLVGLVLARSSESHYRPSKDYLYLPQIMPTSFRCEPPSATSYALRSTIATLPNHSFLATRSRKKSTGSFE